MKKFCFLGGKEKKKKKKTVSQGKEPIRVEEILFFGEKENKKKKPVSQGEEAICVEGDRCHQPHRHWYVQRERERETERPAYQLGKTLFQRSCSASLPLARTCVRLRTHLLCRKRTHSVVREHILRDMLCVTTTCANLWRCKGTHPIIQYENTYYSKRTHSVVREHIL